MNPTLNKSFTTEITEFTERTEVGQTLAQDPRPKTQDSAADFLALGAMLGVALMVGWMIGNGMLTPAALLMAALFLIALVCLAPELWQLNHTTYLNRRGGVSPSATSTSVTGYSPSSGPTRRNR